MPPYVSPADLAGKTNDNDLDDTEPAAGSPVDDGAEVPRIILTHWLGIIAEAAGFPTTAEK